MIEEDGKDSPKTATTYKNGDNNRFFFANRISENGTTLLKQTQIARILRSIFLIPPVIIKIPSDILAVVYMNYCLWELRFSR